MLNKNSKFNLFASCDILSVNVFLRLDMADRFSKERVLNHVLSLVHGGRKQFIKIINHQ